MRFAFCLMTVSLLFALFTVVASATTVARWTPAHASTVIKGKCVGVGKPVAGKFNAFRCQHDGLLWVKVRNDGYALCWSRQSLAKIPLACMTMPRPGLG